MLVSDLSLEQENHINHILKEDFIGELFANPRVISYTNLTNSKLILQTSRIATRIFER